MTKRDVPPDATADNRPADDRPAEQTAALRRLAESELAVRALSDAATPPAVDPSRLIHELQVHQVEVELQNEQLRQSRDEAERLRARYTELYDLAPNGYLTVSADGTMADSNRAAALLLGREYGMLRGRRLGTFVAESDRVVLNAFLARVFSEAAPSGCEVTLGQDAMTARTVAIDGVRSADLSECRLSLTDVTLRRRAESAVRLRDRAMRAVTQGIVITDPNQPGHPIIYVNAGFERMTGYSALEVAGRNCRFLQGEATDRSAVRRLRDAIDGERSFAIELLNYRKDGSSFWNSLYVTPVRDDRGALVQFIGVLVDVTQQRETERALRQSQRMELVGRLAGGVAHDFNNLLTIVRSNVDLLGYEMEKDDPRAGRLVAIADAGERAASLTHQLMAFSRSQMVDQAVLDVNAVIRGLQATFHNMLGDALTLTLDLDPTPLMVRVDESQFGQVLVNLFVIARDAMGVRGSVSIRTSTVLITAPERLGHEELPPGTYALLTVSDTGTGMDARTSARALEPLAPTASLTQVAGLGLALVYGIIKQSAGFVAVDGRPGRGSEFRVYIPLASTTPASTNGAGTDHHAPVGSETIVIADRDAATRQLAHSVLSQQGYTLIQCESTASALESVAAHVGPIDLLIVAQDPLEMTALELIARARKLRPQLRTMLLTNGATAVEDGSDTITRLAKPFSPIALTRSVRAILDAAHAEA